MDAHSRPTTLAAAHSWTDEGALALILQTLSRKTSIGVRPRLNYNVLLGMVRSKNDIDVIKGIKEEADFPADSRASSAR